MLQRSIKRHIALLLIISVQCHHKVLENRLLLSLWQSMYRHLSEIDIQYLITQRLARRFQNFPIQLLPQCRKFSCLESGIYPFIEDCDGLFHMSTLPVRQIHTRIGTYVQNTLHTKHFGYNRQNVVQRTRHDKTVRPVITFQYDKRGERLTYI